jgi:excisionase family DNA binding protein
VVRRAGGGLRVNERPLLAASIRLRKRPGRPKMVRPVPAECVEQARAQASQASAPRTAPGLDSGAARLRGTQTSVAESVAKVGARLLSLEDAAAYLAVSKWTVREWWAAGMLHAVKPILASGKPFRRLLFDRAELDGLIERSKETA